MGIAILSTSRGIMTDREARLNRIGGEKKKIIQRIRFFWGNNFQTYFFQKNRFILFFLIAFFLIKMLFVLSVMVREEITGSTQTL
ncbi:hypothetical protein ACJX0J_002652, partial [Zea mays]